MLTSPFGMSTPGKSAYRTSADAALALHSTYPVKPLYVQVLWFVAVLRFRMVPSCRRCIRGERVYSGCANRCGTSTDELF